MNKPKSQSKNRILLGISTTLSIIFIWLLATPQSLNQKIGSIEWYLRFALIISTTLTFIAVMYFAVPTFVLPFLTSINEELKAREVRKRNEEEAKKTARANALLLYLKKIGLDVTIESKETKKLDDLNYVLSSIKVENKNIDLIELQLHLTEWDSDFGSGVHEYYHCNFVIQLKNKILRGEKLRAKLKPVYKHFLSSDLKGLVWQGNELAQILNDDVNLTAYLSARPRMYNVEIIVDNQFIRIRQGSYYSSFYDGFPSRVTFEACDMIAQRIRNFVNKS